MGMMISKRWVQVDGSVYNPYVAPSVKWMETGQSQREFQGIQKWLYPLVMTNIANWKITIEIVDFPIQYGDSPQLC